ncbi:thioesterase [Kurthia sibirica]|uniref:Thioesterase n=2 Tax=Kurthia sibirica TaxID=202750 RepID=A0A2U3AMJ7_9BACL|nr:thioesterase [Kurthia sibirica]
MYNMEKGAKFMSRLDKLLALGVEQPKSEQLLGIVFESANDGHSICKWHVTPAHLNGAGIVLGGFTTAAADVGMGYAVMSLEGMEEHFTSVSINTTFHRPGNPGEITIDTKVIRNGRTMLYLESELFQNDKLLANVTSTMMKLPIKMTH